MAPAARRLVLLGGLAYALLLVGLAARNGGVLALILPLVVYLGAAALYGPRGVQLRAVRTLGADRVYSGTPVTVGLTITNEGPGLEEVFIEDLFPRELALLEGEASLLASLPPGGSLVLGYTLLGKRGCFEDWDVRVTAGERLGLLRRQQVFPVPSRLWVLPRAARLRRLPIRPLRTRGPAGPVPARQGGSGVDFYGVREYQPGDPRRWINWRISARHPQALFSNEFEQERIADVGLILDARRRSDVRLADDSLFEHAVGATASLAEAFLNDGNRVGLLVYGRFLDWTLPGYGKVQRERILRALARAGTGDSQIFDRLEYLPTRYFPAQSQLVLVSPLCPDDLPMLVRLRARGYQVLVIRPDAIAFELGAIDRRPETDLAARILRLEQGLLLRRLRQAGVQVVDWPVDRPLEQAVHASLGRVVPWFRAVGVEGRG